MDNQTPEQSKKKPGITVPINVVKWLVYSAFFTILLLPFLSILTPWQITNAGLIVGHFAAVLNKSNGKNN